MEKRTYRVWAINDQGASLDVGSMFDGGRFTSINAAAKEARRELGSGWQVHIVDAETQTDVKVFTIR